MKALVTGASGMIGSSLVRALTRQGHQVRAFVRTDSDLGALPENGVELFTGDILDEHCVAAAVEGCECVFHTASIYSYSSRRNREIEETALQGVVNLVRKSHQAGVSRFVLTSSSVTCGYSARPVVLRESSAVAESEAEPAYVNAKIKQEHTALSLAEDLGMDLVCVCPTITIGPFVNRLGPSCALIMSYLQDPFRFSYYGGCNVVASADVARGHILAAEHGQAGEKYLLGSQNLRWLDFHTMISELCGIAPPTLKANTTLCYLAACAEEMQAALMRREPLTGRAQTLMLGRYYWYDIAKARTIGYSPMESRRALALTLAWLTTSPHLSRELRTRLSLSSEIYEARMELKRQQAAAA